MMKHKTVSDFLTSLDDSQRAQVDAVRSIIVAAEPTLIENIKWNAINYIYKDVDRITFSVLNKENKVKLVLHKGSQEKEDKKANPIMTDETGLITWISNIRGTIMFEDLEHITQHEGQLTKVVKKWLSL